MDNLFLPENVAIALKWFRGLPEDHQDKVRRMIDALMSFGIPIGEALVIVHSEMTRH